MTWIFFSILTHIFDYAYIPCRSWVTCIEISRRNFQLSLRQRLIPFLKWMKSSIRHWRHWSSIIINEINFLWDHWSVLDNLNSVGILHTGHVSFMNSYCLPVLLLLNQPNCQILPTGSAVCSDPSIRSWIMQISDNGRWSPVYPTPLSIDPWELLHYDDSPYHVSWPECYPIFRNMAAAAGLWNASEETTQAPITHLLETALFSNLSTEVSTSSEAFFSVLWTN